MEIQIQTQIQTTPNMFSIHLGDFLSETKSTINLTNDYPEQPFDYIGIRETTGTIDIVAVVTADGLSEAQLLARIDVFYNYILGFKKDLLFNRLLKPNGVICFVFENSCKYSLKKILAKKSKINHSNKNGRLVVPWIIDLPAKHIMPHKNPISWFPPVWTKLNPPLGVYPGLKVLEAFLSEYIASTLKKIKPEILPSYSSLEELRIDINELLTEGNIKEALRRLRGSVKLDTDQYVNFTTLSFNYSKIRVEEKNGKTPAEEIRRVKNQIAMSISEFTRELIIKDLKQ